MIQIFLGLVSLLGLVLLCAFTYAAFDVYGPVLVLFGLVMLVVETWQKTKTDTKNIQAPKNVFTVHAQIEIRRIDRDGAAR